MTTTTTASAQQRYAAALRRQRQQHDEAATARVAKQEEDEARRRRLLSVRQQQQGAERIRARLRQLATERAAHELDAEAEARRRRVEGEAAWHSTALASLLPELAMADAAPRRTRGGPPPPRSLRARRCGCKCFNFLDRKDARTEPGAERRAAFRLVLRST